MGYAQRRQNKLATRVGFEHTRAEHNGLAVHCHNCSAKNRAKGTAINSLSVINYSSQFTNDQVLATLLELMDQEQQR